MKTLLSDFDSFRANNPEKRFNSFDEVAEVIEKTYDYWSDGGFKKVSFNHLDSVNSKYRFIIFDFELHYPKEIVTGKLKFDRVNGQLKIVSNQTSSFDGVVYDWKDDLMENLTVFYSLD